jgi:hypothetical protein
MGVLSALPCDLQSQERTQKDRERIIMTDSKSEIVPVQHHDILDISKERVEQGLKKIREFQQIVRKMTTKGQDYGTIPGTKRPTLLKPGAEKITKLLSLADDYDILSKNENWDRENPFFSYTVKCNLRKIGSGELVSSGVGECNSLEAKYRWRWVFPREIPKNLNKEELKIKKTKKGYTLYRIDNDDVFSQVNTILKMAKKRALVDAALSAGRLSEIFTQDIEDLNGNGVLGSNNEEPSGEENTVGSSKINEIKKLLEERIIPDKMREQVEKEMNNYTDKQAEAWINTLKKKPLKTGAGCSATKEEKKKDKPASDDDMAKIKNDYITTFIDCWLKEKGFDPESKEIPTETLEMADRLAQKKVNKLSKEEIEVALSEMKGQEK